MTPQEAQSAADALGPAKHLGTLAVIGAVVGLGTYLTEGNKPTARQVIGRCITSGALGASAASVLAWLPELPFVAQCGIAAALASLGTSGLTLLFQRFLQK